jgi:hypothetical protein
MGQFALMDDPAAYTLAAAFIIGGIAGFVAAVRLFRLVLEYVRKNEHLN